MHLRAWFLAGILAACVSSNAVAAATPGPGGHRQPAVVVVAGPRAPELERLAARELQRYLLRLYGVRAPIAGALPGRADAVFLVGSPRTNPLIRRARLRFPTVTDQGIVLWRTVHLGKPALVVGGGSPRATLWAVYALVERWGVRYLLHGDVLPARRRFRMPEVRVVEEPRLRVRQWRVVNDLAMGPISWGIRDYRPVLDQLAKLRFNRLYLVLWPHQPFVPLEFGGVRASSGTIYFGERYPITDDMVGRRLFGSAKEFWNPDFPPSGGYEAMAAAARRHIRAIMAHGRSRGMESFVGVSLTEFPREFAPVLAHTKPAALQQLGSRTIGPGPDADIDDRIVHDLAVAELRTVLQTYPDASGIVLDVPEWPAWAAQYVRAWRALEAKYGVERLRSLKDAIAAAEARTGYPGGAARAVQEVKAHIVALYFYDRVVSDPAVAALSRSRRIRYVLTSIAEELFPVLARVLPPGSETLNFVDYTPSRIVKRIDALRGVPARAIPSSLIYTLHDDNVGVLPQLATPSLHRLTIELRRLGWAGFSTRYWLIGDHDPCLAYLSRAAWNPTATPDRVYRDQARALYGAAAVPDVLAMWNEVEAATITLEWNGLGLSFPVQGMMMQHWRRGALAPELLAVREQYRRALEAAARARPLATPAGSRELDYWAGRLRFGIEYLTAIESALAGGTAESSGDRAAALRNATAAVDAVTRGLEAYAEVARDRSDLGAIVVVNAYALQPLRQKVAELERAAR